MNESQNIDKELLKKADVLASDLEMSARTYSDIDMIYEKKASREK
jgi:hypothetical protein